MSYVLLVKLLKEMIANGDSIETMTKFFLRKSNKLNMRKRLYVLRRIWKVK